MPFQIVRNNITHMKVDAIVNTTNPLLEPDGGVCTAVFAAAGENLLRAECASLAPVAVGQAVLTKGYLLPAKYVIHTVGPIWQGGHLQEDSLLADSYRSALRIAQNHGFSSLAFPLISSGLHGYPKAQALQIALQVIGAFLLENDMTIFLVVYDREAFEISSQLFKRVQAYIENSDVDERHLTRRRKASERSASSMILRENMESLPVDPTIQYSQYMNQSPAAGTAKTRSLDEVVNNVGESFSEMVLRWIDEKGFSDPDVYRRANVDRRVFSSLRGKDYQPTKRTALAIAIALELNLDQTEDLLRSAGYALSRHNTGDRIVQFFIEEQRYNILEINQVLYRFEQKLLGSEMSFDERP